MAVDEHIVICGAGAIGASVAYFLTRRGARPAVIDRARPAAAASGRAAGFLALDWNAGTPLDELARASFGLHRELADELGAERLGYRPMDALMTAAADDEDLERYRRLPNPGWLDGNVVAHEVIGGAATTAQVDPRRFTTALLEAALERGAELVTGVVDGLAFDGPGGAVSGVSVDGEERPADVVVLALGPWTGQAQRWLALPQVFGTKSASIVLGAEVPAQAVFSEFLGRDRRRSTIEMYPRAGGVVYVAGHPEPRRAARRPGRDRPQRRGVRGAAPRGGRALQRPARRGGGGALGLLPAADRQRHPADRPGPGRPGRVPRDGPRLVGDPERPRHRPDGQRDDPRRRLRIPWTRARSR